MDNRSGNLLEADVAKETGGGRKKRKRNVIDWQDRK